jgi:hypothetical protein
MLTATRWTRYGKDRLYVNDDGNTRVGWIDLQTGTAVLEREEYSAEFDSIVGQHLPAAAPASGSLPATAPTPPAPTQTAVDLAENRAGEAVKAKAAEVRAEAPARNMLARVLGVHTEERAWRVGAKGEAKVGKVLDKLPDGWRVLNGVPVGDRGSDIDHVVIGPGGVFTLNTKHHPGGRVWVAERAVMVNGQKTDYLRNSRHEAGRASLLLTRATGFHVDVQSIIVIVSADITRKADPTGVHVVPREVLKRWLDKRPERLTTESVDAIFEHARWDSTWSSPTN